MLSVQSRKRGTSGAIPTQQTTLSVSWLGRKFRARAVQRGQAQGTWESPEPVEGTSNFSVWLEQAAAHTGYTGSTVSLVLSHPRLAHQLVDAPPAKGPALEKVLERLAQEHGRSLFPGQAAWSAEPVESVKGGSRFLLNLFPKPLLDELTAGARRAGFHLTAVLDPTAVLRDQLLALPTQDSQVVMLAADTGGTTTVLVGRSDGRLVLVRTLPGGWQANAAALAVDLRRTMLFVNQQHGVNVEGLFLFGPDAAERAGELQEQVGLPTRPSPTAYTDDYWATEALRQQKGGSHNFISREQQMAPRRRQLGLAMATATLLVVAMCLGFSAYLWRLWQAADKDLVALRAQTVTLEARHRELQDEYAEVARRREFVDTLALNRPPPVPVWMLGYLGTVIPGELRVTNLVVRKEDRLWRLHLSGTAQPSGTNTLTTALARGVSHLTNQLISGPFHVRLLTPADATGTPTPVSGAPAALADWLAKLNAGQTSRRPVDPVFALEGVIQP